MIKMSLMCKSEKINVPEVFFITNIQTLGNHKILTHFLVVTNLLLGLMVLATMNSVMGCDIFSLVIMVALG